MPKSVRIIALVVLLAIIGITLYVTLAAPDEPESGGPGPASLEPAPPE